MLASMLIIHAMKVAIIMSDMTPVACVCSVCIHLYSGTWCTAQVLYSGGGWWQLDGVFSVLGAVWPSKVHDIQSWYTTCVERYYTLFSTSSTNSTKRSQRILWQRWKRECLACHSFKVYREFWKEETTGVWKICVSSLVHAWIKGHMRKLILLRMYYASGRVDTSLTQDIFHWL